MAARVRARGARVAGLMLAVVLAARAPAQDEASLARVAALRDEGRFAEALAACADVRDPARGAEARLYVRWHGGDLGGALRTGLEGLRAAPTDLALLWASLRLAIDLAVPDLAASLSERLAAALEAAPLDGAQRADWERARRELEGPLEELRATGRAREQALARARAVVAVTGALVLAAWLGWSRR